MGIPDRTEEASIGHSGVMVLTALIWNQLRHYALYPLTFALSLVLARGLGPTEFGLYSGMMALLGILSTVSSLGLEATVSISLPKVTQNSSRQKVSYLLKRLVLLRLIATFLCIAVFCVAPDWVFHLVGMDRLLNDHNTVPIRLIFPILFALSNLALLLHAFYLGLLRFRTLSYIDITGSALCLLLCFLAVRHHWGLAGVLVVYILTQSISTLLLLLGLKKLIMIKSEKASFEGIGSLGANLYSTRMIQYCTGYQKDILLIGFFHQNPLLLGFYGIATKLTEAFDNLFTMGFGEVSLPTFSRVYAQQGRTALGNIWTAFMKLEAFLTIPCLTYAMLKGEAIIRALYSDQYAPAAMIFQVFCALILVCDGIFGGGTSQKVLYAMNSQSFALRLVFVAAIVNVLLALVLIPTYGCLGAVVGTGISMIILRLSELLFAMKLIEVSFPVKYVAQISGLAAVAGVLLFFIPANGVISLAVAGIVYFFVFIVLVYFAKPFSFDDHIALQKVNPRLGYYFGKLCRNAGGVSI